ncbi:MAG TPA: acetyl-CoA carboxylase biotin carboxyl carrier protein [Bryobacteraceae bacterium]|nr:acetyl-CoA carboxylase biotin carboxyl carrier protein [Bryobacteraceae bacterium]
MTLDEIRELIKLVSETGVAELEVQRGENRVRIRRSFTTETSVIMPQTTVTPIPVAVTPQMMGGSVTAQAPRIEPSPAAKEPDTLVYVKSPIVGTFYESASPGVPPFVRIGEHVTPGKVLCIIESMKLMNEIEADAAGVIESKLVQNGQPVEYGEALFGIRPV